MSQKYYLILLFFVFAIQARDVNVQYKINEHVYKVIGNEKKGLYIFNKGATKQVKLVTLNWPPYISEHMCGQGWVQQLAISLLSHRGYQVQVQFLPWARAVRNTELGNVDILYPEYFIEQLAQSDVTPNTTRNQHLILSDPFLGGTIGFIKRKGEKDKYQGQFENLKNVKIGVVRGYQNTPEFDSLLDQNYFTRQLARDDLQNVRLLLAKRVDLIIGDPLVIKHTILSSQLSDAIKKSMLESIETVLPLIQYKPLHFAISKKVPYWKILLQDINHALKEFEKKGVITYIKNQAKNCLN
ncbi:substrate-binding periplasmic protein [Pseudoalteromonas denitrificans]|nr:transporter substrate-binding domain-containing protein [Pseudoalteromonas denitrificans]